jgi:flagellar hook-basal body complex protein FliE
MREEFEKWFGTTYPDFECDINNNFTKAYYLAFKAGATEFAKSLNSAVDNVVKTYKESQELKKHNHYFKDVSHLNHIDVYRVLELFNVTDPCVQHAVKKLLVSGGRGAGKDFKQDIQEAVDSLNRKLQMIEEDWK